MTKLPLSGGGCQGSLVKQLIAIGVHRVGRHKKVLDLDDEELVAVRVGLPLQQRVARVQLGERGHGGRERRADLLLLVAAHNAQRWVISI